MQLTPVKRSLQGLLLFGNLYSSLYLLDVLNESWSPRSPCGLDAASLHRTTMLLLRVLPSVTDKTTAQLCCSMAAQLFALWKRHRAALGLPQWREIMDEISQLERSYSVLRAQGLAERWNAAVPSLHLQILLELVLAARTAISAQPSDAHATAMLKAARPADAQSLLSLGGGGGGGGGESGPAGYVSSSYLKWREGDSTVPLISLSKSALVSGRSLKATAAASNNMYQQNNFFGNSNNQRFDMAETYVGAVAVRAGGQVDAHTHSHAQPPTTIHSAAITALHQL